MDVKTLSLVVREEHLSYCRCLRIKCWKLQGDGGNSLMLSFVMFYHKKWWINRKEWVGPDIQNAYHLLTIFMTIRALMSQNLNIPFPAFGKNETLFELEYTSVYKHIHRVHILSKPRLQAFYIQNASSLLRHFISRVSVHFCFRETLEWLCTS